jgi:teichuronic acid biosynthesis glycosyltransferase TuaC
MKILHICPTNKTGHLPVFIRHQLESLSGSGLIGEIIKFRGDDLKLKKPFNSFNQILNLKRNIYFFKPDLIHAHWGSILGFLVCFLKPKNTKMILTIRGSDLNFASSESYTRNIMRYYLSRIAIRRSNFVIFVSKQLQLSSKIKSPKSTIIPDGTPLKIFKPKNKNYVRKKLKWSNQKKYIIFHNGGRPIDKNLDLAMQTIEILKNNYENIELKVINNGLSQQSLANVLSAADALLFTSLNEGSPNIIREAIACGCPVVSVRVGDVEKWIRLGKAGAVVKHDPALLAKMLEKVLFCNNKKVNFAVSREYSLERSAKLLLEIYNSI